MAAHESPRTTALYDRRDDEVVVDQVERILILCVEVRAVGVLNESSYAPWVFRRGRCLAVH